MRPSPRPSPPRTGEREKWRPMIHKSSRSDCGCPGAAPIAPTRRELLRSASCGFGLMALGGLMANRAYGAAAPSFRPAPHLPARAKHVIFCFMDGGVSHVDSFDPKPSLAKHQGEKIGGARNLTKKTQVDSSDQRVWL